MKVKITHPIQNKPELKVGFEYDLSDKEAEKYLDNEWARAIKEKVKHDNRKNDIK